MHKIHSAINRVLNAFVVILMSLVITAVVVQVFFRYILHSPLVGSEEFAKLSFVWLVFFGAAAVTRDKAHIQVDFFMGLVRPAFQAYVALAMELVTVILFIVVIKYGIEFTKVQAGMKSVGLDIPLTFYSFAVPVGSFFILYYTLLEIIRFKRPKQGSG